MTMTAAKRRLDWDKWAEFAGYGRPLADTHGKRMRTIVLYAQSNIDEWDRLDMALSELTNERERAFSARRAQLTGTEAYVKAECLAFVCELDCEIRLLDARVRACRRQDANLERAWESERSHGSGVKQELRATEASAA